MEGKKIFGVILLIAGGIAVFWGISVQDSFQYRLGSALGRSNGIDPGAIAVIGGIAAIIGLVLLLSNSTESEPKAVDTECGESGDTAEPGVVTGQDKRTEYAEVLSRKSEEELKSMVREEGMYDAAFIAAVREELMERVLGNRVQQVEGKTERA